MVEQCTHAALLLGTALPLALISVSVVVMLYVLATIADTFFCPAGGS